MEYKLFLIRTSTGLSLQIAAFDQEEPQLKPSQKLAGEIILGLRRLKPPRLSMRA